MIEVTKTRFLSRQRVLSKATTATRSMDHLCSHVSDSSAAVVVCEYLCCGRDCTWLSSRRRRPWVRRGLGWSWSWVGSNPGRPNSSNDHLTGQSRPYTLLLHTHTRAYSLVLLLPTPFSCDAVYDCIEAHLASVVARAPVCVARSSWVQPGLVLVHLDPQYPLAGTLAKHVRGADPLGRPKIDRARWWCGWAGRVEWAEREPPAEGSAHPARRRRRGRNTRFSHEVSDSIPSESVCYRVEHVGLAEERVGTA